MYSFFLNCRCCYTIKCTVLFVTLNYYYCCFFVFNITCLLLLHFLSFQKKTALNNKEKLSLAYANRDEKFFKRLS